MAGLISLRNAIFRGAGRGPYRQIGVKWRRALVALRPVTLIDVTSVTALLWMAMSPPNTPTPCRRSAPGVARSTPPLSTSLISSQHKTRAQTLWNLLELFKSPVNGCWHDGIFSDLGKPAMHAGLSSEDFVCQFGISECQLGKHYKRRFMVDRFGRYML